MRPFLRKPCVVRPARLGPREGLELELMKMGRTRPLLEPRCRLQAGKYGVPLRESWIRGYPDSRTIYFGRTVGL